MQREVLEIYRKASWLYTFSPQRGCADMKCEQYLALWLITGARVLTAKFTELKQK